jgi:hypothetical protein
VLVSEERLCSMELVLNMGWIIWLSIKQVGRVCKCHIEMLESMKSEHYVD